MKQPTDVKYKESSIHFETSQTYLINMEGRRWIKMKKMDEEEDKGKKEIS